MRSLLLLLLPAVVSVPIALAQTPVAPFSADKAGAAPQGWEAVKLTDNKNPTVYDLVDDGGTVVLHAMAENAASALGHRTSLDVNATPIVQWRWKVKNLIEGADNAVAAKEDSPVRLMFEFEGDKSKLGIGERALFLVSRGVSGRELPYATLMYIWSNKAPVGTVIPNPHTKRIKMVVASSGSGEVGNWQTLQRNLAQDFEKAFGEKPGKLTAVGIMTDTDNTGAKTEAWYGDIRFGAAGQ
jgi:hypothetical protein